MTIAEVVSDDHRVLLYVEPADQVSPAAAAEVTDALEALRGGCAGRRTGSSAAGGGRGTAARTRPADPGPRSRRSGRSRRERLVLLAGVALAASLVVGVVGAW